MTIPRSTNKAKRIIKKAHDIKCYSLSNNFSGAPLTDNPVVWAPITEGEYKHLITVSQTEFLMRELNGHGAKLTGPLVHGSIGMYHLTVHSNLWYEFKSPIAA